MGYAISLLRSFTPAPPIQQLMKTRAAGERLTSRPKIKAFLRIVAREALKGRKIIAPGASPGTERPREQLTGPPARRGARRAGDRCKANRQVVVKVGRVVETFGRRCGTVRRPGHNESGK